MVVAAALGTGEDLIPAVGLGAAGAASMEIEGDLLTEAALILAAAVLGRAAVGEDLTAVEGPSMAAEVERFQIGVDSILVVDSRVAGEDSTGARAAVSAVHPWDSAHHVGASRHKDHHSEVAVVLDRGDLPARAGAIPTGAPHHQEWGECWVQALVDPWVRAALCRPGAWGPLVDLLAAREDRHLEKVERMVGTGLTVRQGRDPAPWATSWALT